MASEITPSDSRAGPEIVDGRTPVADRIRERVRKAGARFHANDNIAAYIEDGELEELQAEVATQMADVLQALVIDTESDHNTRDTARRVAKMYVREVFGGRYLAEPPVTEFPNAARLSELMIIGPVTVRSACSHHFCPIIGRIWVGVMPDEHSALIGLSKYARLVEWVMTRPQIQEEAARWPRDRDGSRPLLHAVAGREGHGLQDDQQHHARFLPKGPEPPARVPRAARESAGLAVVVLVRLLYASRATQAIDEALQASIVRHSQAQNLEHGVTGVLCTYPEGGVFLQVLEGARRPINTLFNNIGRDQRHQDVTILSYEEIVERRFASWRMGSVDLKRVNVSTILRFSEKAVLDPFTMPGEAALALLQELVETAAIVTRDVGPV
jgi:GTP cyclohydrolase I